MGKMPHSDKSARAQKRAAAKNPAQPQAPVGGLDADKLFSRIGQLDYSLTELRQENFLLKKQIEGLEAANDNLNKMVEKLTPKPPSKEEEARGEELMRSQESSEAESPLLAQQEPSPEELAEEELLAQAKQEAEES